MFILGTKLLAPEDGTVYPLKRQDSHIIDLAKTVEALDKALPFITGRQSLAAKVLFVGTKNKPKISSKRLPSRLASHR